MRLELVQPRTAMIFPFMSEGKTKGGLIVRHHASLPPVLGRVLLAHSSCRGVRTGQVIVFRPHSFEEARTSLGEIRIIHEDSVAGHIEGFDEPKGDK